jgi:hypothetical protein
MFVQLRILSLFPNPASEYVIAEHPAVNRDAVLKLVDIYGRIVSTTRVSRNALQTQVRLTGLPASTYRLVWTDGIRVITKTLIIKK